MAKHTPNARVPKAAPRQDLPYYTWSNDKERATAFAKMSENINHYSRASFRDRNYKDVDTNVSVRPSFDRGDYEYWRPGEALPRNAKEAIEAAMRVYKDVGLIKNVIDLMGDFTCQGIKIVHPNSAHQKFGQKWFELVHGKVVSERFANLLYRSANVVVRRRTGKIKKRDNVATIDDTARAAVTPQLDSSDPEIKVEALVIPWRYTFLSPLSIEAVNEELAAFVGKPLYRLKIPKKLVNAIKNPKEGAETKLVSLLPKEITDAVNRGDNFINLDPATTSVFHYKKDDWEAWAYPMTNAILTDIYMYDKLKRTDIAACDSAISTVRLWKLGDLEQHILPGPEMIDKLANILNNNVGGGSMDLVWGPELDFKESNSNIHHFLGTEKYEPCLNAMYAGLGIPPTLTGAATSSGFTNNYISLKTLTERLNYGRTILIEFWRQELAILQKAMGFPQPFQIHFDRMTLSDESAEKALLIQLADRDIISIDTLLERFDEMPEMEKKRIAREYKERDKGNRPDKASGFHQPDHKYNLEKLFATQGTVTPSEVGLELQDKKVGEKTLVQQNNEMKALKATTKAKTKGTAGQGRPKTSGDKSKRKTKVVKPKSRPGKAMVELWAKSALASLHDTLTPAVLKTYDKKNLRSLSYEQADSFEAVKFSLLCNLQPFTEVSPDLIENQLKISGSRVPVNMQGEYDTMKAEFKKTFNRDPNMDDLRQIQTLVYVNFRGET